MFIISYSSALAQPLAPGVAQSTILQRDVCSPSSRQISSSTRSRITRLGNHDRITRAAAGVATRLA